ncbi:MAG: hypothetical protein FD178_2111 [Ignavibacteria bacterium]|nr:MAG: hypothetical protein FD178_2111 [Ignavibacteria bacterium]
MSENSNNGFSELDELELKEWLESLEYVLQSGGFRLQQTRHI